MRTTLPSATPEQVRDRLTELAAAQDELVAADAARDAAEQVFLAARERRRLALQKRQALLKEFAKDAGSQDMVQASRVMGISLARIYQVGRGYEKSRSRPTTETTAGEAS